ncbi:FAD-dependent oxidoreductase [Sphingosinicella sp. LHD-64]|uniref:NAD(P)/FAD-dependent oxidoreductase n=1 Tax=Sphingosinicella sp. LHD-64 TaxID=3072139 RepID=UPI00280E2E06|nr:FAD-dependent oxidoreductase [Sphingosinicella sp. LHD-64]MDQ8755388.1 FAD-dependent oxidoreductase [Sphingosinicella sp. LHD-64]
MKRCDVAIVGAGMAGASLAAEIAGEASVLLLEAESQPGYHSTGRSAAFWSETYGGPFVQPLTSASGPFLADPPADFSERPFLGPRGAVHIARMEGKTALDALAGEFAAAGVSLGRMGRAEIEAVIPELKPGWDHGLSEPTCADIDVAALHVAYLRRARARGSMLVPEARVLRGRHDRHWRLETTAGIFEAEVLVNAAGAWADELAGAVGARPVGIRPYRRTVVQLRTDPPAPAGLPLVIDALGRFYFKPEAGGRLWVSPHDETPCDPGDCAPEEIDVAIAIDRLETVVDWQVDRVERSWAGLRSFAPDRLPVYGFDPDQPGFFWFVGQGGFGIQTAPAAARLGAALLLGHAPDPMVAGIDPAPYAAGRFA